MHVRASNQGTRQTAKAVHALTDGSGALREGATHEYDVQGRMRQAAVDSSGDPTPERTSTYACDDSGLRVRQSETEGGTTTTTAYTIAPANPTGYAQVLEEKQDTDSDGIIEPSEVVKAFTLGLDVIAQQATAVASGAPLFLLWLFSVSDPCLTGTYERSGRPSARLGHAALPWTPVGSRLPVSETPCFQGGFENAPRPRKSSDRRRTR